MLRWALFFLLVGLVAGVLGFTGIAGVSIEIARILFFLFMATFLILLLLGVTIFRSVSGP
jgi:uncharacterized membrane protein YtjA (UPF0391 family)